MLVGYDGSVGGVIAIRVSGKLRVSGGGVIEMGGRGYRGGAIGSAGNCDGYQGESRIGTGVGGNCSGDYNSGSNDEWDKNDGGGWRIHWRCADLSQLNAGLSRPSGDRWRRSQSNAHSDDVQEYDIAFLSCRFHQESLQQKDYDIAALH